MWFDTTCNICFLSGFFQLYMFSSIFGSSKFNLKLTENAVKFFFSLLKSILVFCPSVSVYLFQLKLSIYVLNFF